jgi:hypothetical protein
MLTCIHTDLQRRRPWPKSTSAVTRNPQLPPRPLQIIHPRLPRNMHAHHIPPLLPPTPHIQGREPPRCSPPLRALGRSNPLRQSTTTRTIAQGRGVGRAYRLWECDGAVQSAWGLASPVARYYCAKCTGVDIASSHRNRIKAMRRWMDICAPVARTLYR